MCIIASSEIGMTLPSTETIKTMWRCNSDGAGFMYNKDNKVIIKKGFMTLDAFNKALEELKKEIDTVNSTVIMHFRIGTHGGNIPENTHPFPVTCMEPLLKKLTVNTDIGMAHNGIINTVQPRNNISDTMEYVLEFLSEFKYIDKNFYTKRLWQKVIENTINGSRMCFLDGSGSVTYIGNWHTDETTGVKYSNTGYQRSYWQDNYISKYSKYNWDLDYRLNNLDEYDDDYDYINDWDYVEVSLLKDGYISFADGEKYEIELDANTFFIDCHGYVYQYDTEFELAVRLDNATAYTPYNTFARYDDNDAIFVTVISEEGYDDYVAEYWEDYKEFESSKK